jgi:uncharacterized protein (DUF1015 family)
MTSPLLKPFAAVRPRPDHAQNVIARPYDVVSFAEARAAAVDRPLSFLHVSRAEIDLPEGTDPHADVVYARAASAFQQLLASGALICEEAPCYYAYRMEAADGHTQLGVAGAASVAAYEANRIRRHEHTRPDKELDRTKQIKFVGAHTGPVLLANPPDEALNALLRAVTETEPVADAYTDEGTRHRVWRVGEDKPIAAIAAAFSRFTALHIADGHHRSAAAARLFRESGAGDGHFLAVAFPANQLRILGYHRIVRDLGAMSVEAFLTRLEGRFRVVAQETAVTPERRGVFGLCLGGRWYRLEYTEPPAADASPVDRLDVSVLSAHVLRPILGIVDERTDPRIDFVGGGRGVGELERQVRAGAAAAAFALFPTHFADVVAVADAGDVMPPKSTWFEPKLADGLLSLPLSGAV